LTTTAAFSNAGTVILDGSTFTAATYTQTGGTTNLVNYGSLVAAVNVQGGILSGQGFVLGNLTNGGRVQPGGAGAVGDLYVFGNYTQTATGQLDLDLGGVTPTVDQDLLYVDGTAALAGGLTLNLLGSYRPNPDDFFVFFWSNGGITGDFSTINGTDLGGGLYLLPFTDGFGYYLFAYLI
jgi:hypothetical protein